MTRRIFFMATALWGYLLGAAGIYIFCCRHGSLVDPDFYAFVFLFMSIVLVIVGALVFHRAYREYRKKNSRI